MIIYYRKAVSLKTNFTYPKAAVAIAAFLIILSLSSLFYLILPREEEREYVADIFQNGVLIQSIPLSEIRESQIFTITGENGCVNEIEVRPGSIGIISADCPDKLCVHQGFIHDSRLPVTCLPNRLVIQLRPVSSQEDDTSPDMITY